MTNDKKLAREQDYLNDKNHQRKSRKEGCGHGRKWCKFCTGSSVGKALHKGHGNMKKYWSNYSFSEEDTAIFGDDDFIGLIDMEEFDYLYGTL